MYSSLKPLLFRLSPETAHRLTVGAARIAAYTAVRLLDPVFDFQSPALKITLWGHQYPNPVGLAAGFDKNARLIDFWPHVGFGFAEVGSVTYRASKGNPRPRLFRLPEDHALINRMGLNNQGAPKIAKRIGNRGMYHPFPLGINLAKTNDPAVLGEAAVEDYVESFRLLGPKANYIALNISCPNTADGRTFEDPEALDRLLDALLAARTEMSLRVPVLVKLSPAISERIVFDSLLEELVSVCLERKVQGFIATNTASDRSGLRTDPATLDRIGPGGLSGPPIAKRSNRLITYLHQKTAGRLPIIGVGGIDSGTAAYEKIRAGASLVQLYTGLIYEGPGLVMRVKQDLVRLLEEDGYLSVGQAIGTALLDN